MRDRMNILYGFTAPASRVRDWRMCVQVAEPPPPTVWQRVAEWAIEAWKWVILPALAFEAWMVVVLALFALAAKIAGLR